MQEQIIDFDYLKNDYNLQGLNQLIKQKITQGYKIRMLPEQEIKEDQFNLNIDMLPDYFIQSSNRAELSNLSANMPKLDKDQIQTQPLIQDNKLDTYHSSQEDEVSKPNIHKYSEKQDQPIDNQQEVQESYYQASLVTYKNITNIKKTEFMKKMQKNLFFQRLQKSNKQLNEGNLQNALKEVQQVVNEIFSLLLTEKQDRSLIKQYTIISIQALVTESQIYQQMSLIKKAISCLENILKRFIISDIQILSCINFNLGYLYLNDLQFQNASTLMYEMLIIFEKVNLRREMAKCLSILSYCYSCLKFFETSKKLCYEAIHIYRELTLDDNNPLAESYYYLGFNFYMNKDYDFALVYLDKALELKDQTFDQYHISCVRIENLIALIYFYQENYDKSIMILEGIIEKYDYFNLIDMNLIQILNNLGMLYLMTLKFQKSKICFEKGLEIIDELDNGRQFEEKRQKLQINLCISEQYIEEKNKKKKLTFIRENNK